ncbi:MAG: hypothetical protein WCS85_00295 [Candidatus Peribacteraceae bacterium]
MIQLLFRRTNKASGRLGNTIQDMLPSDRLQDSVHRMRERRMLEVWGYVRSCSQIITPIRKFCLQVGCESLHIFR